MKEIKCEKCGSIEKIELHHIIPKSINWTDKDGRVYLCKKCHDIIHKMLLGWIWAYIPEKDRENAKFSIKESTKWYVRKKWE